MKKVSLLLCICMFLLMGAAMAGTHATKGSPAKASTVKMEWDSFKPETLHGTILLIDAPQKRVFITSRSIPYEVKVTKATKIEIAGSKSNFSSLKGQTKKEASVTFIARAGGNYAQNITVTG